MYTKAVPAKNPLKSVLVDEHGIEMHRQSRFLTNVRAGDGTGGSASIEFKELISKDQKIQVHYFGDTKVTIGEDDEKRYKGHNFNEGEQRGCMKLIQFTKKENIRECYYIGRNSFVVVPGWEKKTSDRDSEAMLTTLSLISAMLENDVVAICRYAPDAAKHLQLMALIPHRDEELDLPYLQALRLPFAEDMRPFNFVNLNVTCPKPSHKQLNFIDELIDVMQFNTENGSLEPTCVLNPFFQRQCTAMKLKALNTIDGDDKKICDLIAPSSFLKRGLEPDSKMLKTAKHVLDAIQSEESGFCLQEVVKPKRVKQEIRQEDISEWLAELEAAPKEEISAKTKDTKKPTQVRFIDRARARLTDNFEFHMASLLDEVSVMTAAEDEEAEQLYGIAHARLLSLRELAIEFGRPTEFNEWLLCSKSQWPEWAQFCMSRSSLLLISCKECSSSEYTESEANMQSSRNEWIVMEQSLHFYVMIKFCSVCTYLQKFMEIEALPSTMNTSQLPDINSLANEIEQLSTTLAPEADATLVKDVLYKEVKDTSHGVFPCSVSNSMGICDLVLESSKQRVIIKESQHSITAQQIVALTNELLRAGKNVESVGDVIPVSTFWSILSRSPKAIRDCFCAAVVEDLVFSTRALDGCISCQLVVDFLRTCSRRSQQGLLVQSYAKGVGFITSNEFVDLVTYEISNKLTWTEGMKNSPYYYAVFIERSVFLHLDPQRTGKVLIEDLTSTRLLDDLFDVILEHKRENKEQLWDVSQLSWCSVNNFWRVLEQFRRCDRDWSGMVSLKECEHLKDGVYTPLFLKRVYATQMLYGDNPKEQEMDFRGFVELDVAIHTRKAPASIKWLFRVLDLRDDGILDRDEIKLMTQNMITNLSTLEGWSNFNADDITDEVIDMINPKDPSRITVDDVIASRMADTAFGILIDYSAFLKYETREEEAAT
ncbi:hypothetical protein RB195_007118 [Necator americanus]|uniref:EF-hand domain-containing protein n=1 Tax=Necator americanus TaxID=51031 RepID=A0ABR1BYI9_NECAM